MQHPGRRSRPHRTGLDRAPRHRRRGARPARGRASSAPSRARISATLDEIVDTLAAETTRDEFGFALPRPSHCAIHQLHVGGKFPDVGINDPRDRLFAVIEAQRGRADDHHIAKLAANYVPRSGARLGILVAEGWRRSSVRHPAWAVCPAPVVVVVTLDALSEPDYQIAWVHHPTVPDGDDT